MQFLLQLVGSEGEGDWEFSTPEEMEEIMAEMSRYNRSMVEAGVMVDGAGLEAPSTATTVTFDENNDTVLSDGPFAETKEHLAGYWVIQVDSLDEALEWTRKAPVRGGKIEVRPVMGFGKPITIEEFDAAEEAAKAALRETAQQRTGDG